MQKVTSYNYLTVIVTSHNISHWRIIIGQSIPYHPDGGLDWDGSSSQSSEAILNIYPFEWEMMKKYFNIFFHIYNSSLGHELEN